MELIEKQDRKAILEAEIAVYDAKRRVDDALIKWIAKRLAGSLVPHYEHHWDAEKMLKAIQEVSTVEPNLKRLVAYGLLSETSDEKLNG